MYKRISHKRALVAVLERILQVYVQLSFDCLLSELLSFALPSVCPSVCLSVCLFVFLFDSVSLTPVREKEMKAKQEIKPAGVRGDVVVKRPAETNGHHGSCVAGGHAGDPYMTSRAESQYRQQDTVRTEAG